MPLFGTVASQPAVWRGRLALRHAPVDGAYGRESAMGAKLGDAFLAQPQDA